MSSPWLRLISRLLTLASHHFILFALAGSLVGPHPLRAQANAPATAQPSVGEGWPTYGGDPGGLRFSKSSEITRSNLGQLHAVWTFHTHAVDSATKYAEMPS